MTPAREPRLRLRLSPVAATQIRKRHPWVFASAVRASNRPGATGEIAFLYDPKDQFLGFGLFDGCSPIQVRMLHTGKPAMLDHEWWGRRLDAALCRRMGQFTPETNGWRWMHGESDGWPGLVLDRYAETLVLKIYTAAWFPWIPSVVDLIRQRTQPECIVLRLSRNIAEQAGKAGYSDGDVLHGDPETASRGVWFLENGLCFEADVLRGQKTGFFLDQRENRARVGELSSGRDVLNAFSYTGGFSLYAARGGARSVTSLDISAHALAGAGRLFQRNHGRGRIPDCQHHEVRADAFAWIASARPASYDLVILDPPSLAKKSADREAAISAYRDLAFRASRLLRPRGILVAASCSAHVPSEIFFGILREATRSANCHELQTTGHPKDHPAGFPEAAYLKCIYLEKR